MIEVKKLINFSTLTTLLFILSSANCGSALEQSITKISVDTDNEENTIKVQDSDLMYLEQNRLVSIKLIEEGYENVPRDITFTRDLADLVVNYLSNNKDREENITELARLLLRPLGEYGSEHGEEISTIKKMSVIHDWLERAILGMSFQNWILKEVRTVDKGNDSYLKHGLIKRRLMNHLNDETSFGFLTTAARKYFLENILQNVMPSFTLQPSINEEIRLHLINLTEPEFGYLHVGLKLINNLQSKDEVLSLDDFMDIGIFIETLFRQINVTDIEFFDLPAKIYYVSTMYADVQSTQFFGSFYFSEYFKMMDDSRHNNPMYQFMDRLGKWKTRSQLALGLLKENDVSKNFLSGYLYNKEGSFLNSKNEKILLPNIDNIFHEQNMNIKNPFRELNKLLLLQTFNNIDNKHKNFIHLSSVYTVQAKLLNDDLRFRAGALTDDELHYDSIVKNLGDVYIDLLQCKLNDEERIYVLDLKNYTLLPLKKDKFEILKLYKEEDPGRNFKLNFFRISLMKKEGETLEILANHLSEMYSKQFYNSLKTEGYDATFWQKLDDFFLSLLPFYSCVSEWSNGNYNEAAVPCLTDILSLVPFVGQSIKAAYKFGYGLVGISRITLRLAAKEVTFDRILTLKSKQFLQTGILDASKILNAQDFQGLGHEFLRSIDPGFGLLKLGGREGVKFIKHASEYLQDGYPKLMKKINKFTKQAENEISSQNSISDIVLSTKQVVQLPGMNTESMVVKIGTERGKDVLVRLIPGTNIPFGRKYVGDPKTGVIELAPIPLREKVFLIRTEGLGGRGVGNAARMFGRWEERYSSLVTSDVTELVYRVDSREPAVVLPQDETPGGCLPRKGTYNYNLEAQHDLNRFDNENDLSVEETTPFVSTYSNLQKAINYGKNRAAIEEYRLSILSNVNNLNKDPDDVIKYIYKIRPASNFYNLRQSYIAARDVSMPGSPRYNEIDQIIQRYGDADEYSALNGFNKDRIIAYAELKRSTTDISELEWVDNPMYNSVFDFDSTATDLYTRVAIRHDGDFMDMAINIVQQAHAKFGKTVPKRSAKTALLFQLRSDEVKDMVIKYNTHKDEQLSKALQLNLRNPFGLAGGSLK